VAGIEESLDRLLFGEEARTAPFAQLPHRLNPNFFGLSQSPRPAEIPREILNPGGKLNDAIGGRDLAEVFQHRQQVG
jgi:hypothetical protein